MDQTKPANGSTQTNPSVLPGIEHMQRAARPRTSDSSATTVPPSSIPNTEDSIIPTPDVPIATLLSALPVNTEALPSNTKPKHQEGDPAQRRPRNGQARDQGQADKMNAEPPVESQGAESVQKSQKGKRRAPPQGRKAKRPRLGASQANLKKRTKTPARRSRAVKGKKATLSEGTSKKDTKNVQITQNAPNEAVKVGSNANEGEIVTMEKMSVPQPCQLAVQEVDKIEKGSSKPMEKSGECSVRRTTAVITSIDCRNSGKDNDGSQANDKITAEAEQTEKGEQPSSRADDAQQKEKDSGAARAPANNTDKDSQRQDGPASKETDKPKKACPDAQEEASLREKYEDLSRRYLSLVRGMVQSACHKKDGDSSDSDNEGADRGAKTEIVDQKLYDTLYLCKVAGMLGAMKIDGGPSKRVRTHRLRGVEDPYNRVVTDGFEFAEDLMKLGRPDENSYVSVKRVFRDVHVRLVKDIWERNQDKQDAKCLLLQMITMIGEQLKVWYMKIMDGKLNVLWSQVIGVKLGEAVYKEVVKMDDEISGFVVGCLRDVLKYISEYYEECERKPDTACLEKFCYSCEVSISIARSVPDAALTLEEEVAYAIGRHNGVFSHCVSRLLAEREAKKNSC